MIQKFAILVLLILAASSATQASELDEDTLRSPISLLSGQTVRLSQYKNSKPVYIKFWATYCRECMQQMPHLQRAYEKYGNKVQFIAVNLGVDDDEASVEVVKKKFGLTMPIAIDKSGELAKSFNVIATPYHVIIDKTGKIIVADYVKTTGVDKQLALIAKGKAFSAENSISKADTGASASLGDISTKPTALFFVATWCDWYLKDSRPLISQNCIAAQKQVNALYSNYPQVNWIGIATRLWTGAPELAEYKKKFDVKHKLIIDTTNNVTYEYGVKNYPTLILLSNGKEVFRTQQINSKEVSIKLAKLTAK